MDDWITEYRFIRPNQRVSTEAPRNPKKEIVRYLSTSVARLVAGGVNSSKNGDEARDEYPDESEDVK